MQWDAEVIQKTGAPDTADPVILRFKDGTQVKNYSVTCSAIDGYDFDHSIVLADKLRNGSIDFPTAKAMVDSYAVEAMPQKKT